MTFSYNFWLTIVVQETTGGLMEMRKRSHSLRKKILVAIELRSNSLHCGKT